jgi:hypothetical protein
MFDVFSLYILLLTISKMCSGSAVFVSFVQIPNLTPSPFLDLILYELKNVIFYFLYRSSVQTFFILQKLLYIYYKIKGGHTMF